VKRGQLVGAMQKGQRSLLRQQQAAGEVLVHQLHHHQQAQSSQTQISVGVGSGPSEQQGWRLGEESRAFVLPLLPDRVAVPNAVVGAVDQEAER